MIISLPLEVYITKNKKFILNLNGFRNAHFRTLASAKKIYTENLLWKHKNLPKFSKPVSLRYRYYHHNRGKVDISNPCSIIDKFACDFLVKAGVLPEDNYNHVVRVVYEFGGVDKDNPRCELTVIEIEDNL
jgi:hypothetical protein